MAGKCEHKLAENLVHCRRSKAETDLSQAHQAATLWSFTDIGWPITGSRDCITGQTADLKIVRCHVKNNRFKMIKAAQSHGG